MLQHWRRRRELVFVRLDDLVAVAVHGRGADAFPVQGAKHRTNLNKKKNRIIPFRLRTRLLNLALAGLDHFLAHSQYGGRRVFLELVDEVEAFSDKNATWAI